ncbi:MAG: GTP 3',8-cyclase MoaA [Flammeovirgaceae bacterium]|nr:GTP 3',8-cyclase MoaA [Flammeovirgaceae bacterium]
MNKSISTIYDNHRRPINYLRLAVTDRCNLRCFYCMPAKGIHYLPKKELLSYEEMERLIDILGELGISKVRITGGEPFLRKDLIRFLRKISEKETLQKISITTNGVLTERYIPQLKELGINSINLSLDTLDRDRFFKITRRDEFSTVERTLNKLLENNFDLKINMVVMEGQNTQDIIPLAKLAKDMNIGVRFIEEMPFNGVGKTETTLKWDHHKIFEVLKNEFKDIDQSRVEAGSTSQNYTIPGFQGNLGIIAAYSRTFCGSCNRIRISSQGLLKTCLYDDGVLSLRDLIREGKDNEFIKAQFLNAFKHRAKDGFEAEGKRKNASSIKESMSTIGG